MHKLLLIMLAAGLIMLPETALAVENEHNGHINQSSTSKFESEMSRDDHQQMDRNVSTETGDDHEGQDSVHSHGSTPIKESPPNLKVLLTFGVINAAFLLIGVWQKWFLKKKGAAVG